MKNLDMRSCFDERSWKLLHSDDWSDFTYSDLRHAIDGALVATLTPGSNQTYSDFKFWINTCRDKVDYLLYCSNFMNLFMDNSNMTIAEVVESSREQKLTCDSKRNLFVSYFNTYFYRYISKELSDLREIVETNKAHLLINELVDYYITCLLYEEVITNFQASNPNNAITYQQIEGVTVTRKEELREVRDALVVALGEDNTTVLFEKLFLLMTYYVGSGYRRVHAAVMAILGMDMTTFRETFYANLDNIIQSEGSVVPTIT